MADRLFLATHELVGQPTRENKRMGDVGKTVQLHVGCDVECHKGTDGIHYVLDTARVLPPECYKTTTYDTEGKRNGHLPMAPGEWHRLEREIDWRDRLRDRLEREID